MPVVQDAIIEVLTAPDSLPGSGSALDAAVEEVRPRIAEMVSMGRADWEDRFFDLGYDYDELHSLENRLRPYVDERRIANALRGMLGQAGNPRDEKELRPIIRHCFAPAAQAAVLGLVFNRRFPDHAITLAIVVRRMANLADFILFAEDERRADAELPAEEPARTDAMIAAAQALADLGLAEKAAEWPPY